MWCEARVLGTTNWAQRQPEYTGNNIFLVILFFCSFFFLPFLVSFFSFLRVAFNVPRMVQVRSSCIQNRLITCMPPVTPPVRHLIAVKEPSLAGDTAANTTMVQQELVGVVSGAFSSSAYLVEECVFPLAAMYVSCRRPKNLHSPWAHETESTHP